MYRLLTYSFIFLFLAKTGFSQDPQFSQPYASALYLNPALTGDTKKNRLSMTYRNQWSAIENGFSSYIASYDHYNKNKNSGFGGYLLYDQSGMNGYRVTGLSFSYSYDAKIDHWSGIKGGLAIGYSFMGFNQNDLLFADQVIRDGASTSIESNIQDHTSYLDMSAGILYYSRFVWAGMSASHLNTPNISLIDQEQKLPIKFSFHGGVKVWNKRDNKGKEIRSFNLVAHYKSQSNWDQFDFGLYYNYSPIIFGLWYRGIPLLKSYEKDYSNHESLIVMVGLEYNSELRVAYSYDITISKLTMTSGGSHEISVIYEWPKKRKSIHRRRIACPKF